MNDSTGPRAKRKLSEILSPLACQASGVNLISTGPSLEILQVTGGYIDHAPACHEFDSRTILAVLTISFVVINVIRRFILNRQYRYLPPGPVPLPLLGSLLSIGKEPWLTYTKWGAAYGDLVFVRILDQDVVVLSSQYVAEALLDKRSRIYSDRPYLATVKPFGWSCNFGFLGYNDEWRLRRRLFHQTFRPESARKFCPMHIKRAHEMIVNMIDDPQRYYSHFATFTSSTAMSVVYGYEPSPRDDPLVHVITEAVELGFAVMTPEKAIILKTFPFCK
ncbi:cytochrome P450, partial [Rhizopogon vinicolor AM-OR11-026]